MVDKSHFMTFEQINFLDKANRKCNHELKLIGSRLLVMVSSPLDLRRDLARDAGTAARGAQEILTVVSL